MTPQGILHLILAIISFSYLFDQLLEYLNLKAQRHDIPSTISAFYASEKYHRSLDYHKDVTQFGFITASVGFIISFCMLYWGIFGWLDGYLNSLVDHAILRALIFFAVLMVASDLITIPFQWYRTFVIEQKYEFNKTTPKLFIVDKLKGYLLTALIGGVLLSLLLWLIDVIGVNFWLWFSFIAAFFILLLNMFYTSIILPMFNKLTPLADGELKSAIQAYSQRVGFPLDNIFVIDGSKRSSKSNAFFSGLGKKKKIVLYDTLINNHTTDELVAVLAHEVGHFKKKHIVWGYVLSVFQIFFTLFVLSLIIFNESVSMALGAEAFSISVNLVAFTILFSPISAITGLLINMYSRKNEYEADAYAASSFNPSSLTHALKKLSVDNLSNLYPHPWYVFFHYSHPPLLKRLSALEEKQD